MIFSSLGAISNFKCIVYPAGFYLLFIIIFIVIVKEKSIVNDARIAREIRKKYVRFVSDGMLAYDDDINV
jgi:hypothetical protein